MPNPAYAHHGGGRYPKYGQKYRKLIGDRITSMTDASHMFTPAPISHSGMNHLAPVLAPAMPALNACPSSRQVSSNDKPPPRTMAVCTIRRRRRRR
jgi:hypothetical protein